MSRLSIRKGVAPPFLALLLIALAGVSLCAQTLTLSSRSGPPTTRITVHGTGFPPAAVVTVAFGRSVAPVVSDGSGAFQTQIEVPDSAQPGLHRVTAKSGTTVLAATGFLVRTNWPQFGFNAAGDRWNPYENTLSVSTAPALVERWSVPAGNAVDTPVVVANGVAYVGAGPYLLALNASTGARRWTHRFPANAGAHIGSSPAVANGAVYVGVDDGYLYALNASTGVLLWKFPVNQSRPPAVANGVVYVVSYLDHTVTALNASTGAWLWGVSISFDTWGDTAPVVADGAVYVEAGNSVLYAWNASTGELLWNFTPRGSSFSSPAVANGVVYIASWIEGVHNTVSVNALNASTGALLWNFAPADVVMSLAVANGVVYAGSYDNNLYALNARTGALLWSFATGAIVDTSAVANGVVYTGESEGKILALDAGTGALLWSVIVEGTGISNPSVAVVNGLLYVGVHYPGKVYAFGLPSPAAAPEDSPEN